MVIQRSYPYYDLKYVEIIIPQNIILLQYVWTCLDMLLDVYVEKKNMPEWRSILSADVNMGKGVSYKK